ncbi:N-6 DNA methylase [Patescibacteria group bacterium]|nr:N-6 DNA methylase [Patescibacteria group bacterium]
MISRNEIRVRAREFSKEWEREVDEDAEAKSFWDAFFMVFGVSRRRVAAFEHFVHKQDGGQGFIDVLWPGVMLAEHKSRGKSLDRAFSQAKDYFPGLKDAELPRYVVVSDFALIRVYDLDNDTEVEFSLSDLDKHIELFGFISGYEVRKYEAEEEASIKAAELMAKLHEAIEVTGYSGHDLEVFLVRILFCLFADDTEIFEKGSFRRYIEQRTSEEGSDLGFRLLELFDVLNTPDAKRQTTLDEQLSEFPYINGAIFAERIGSITLDHKARATLLTCCAFNWSGISAAIFGSLFQGVMNKQERRELGAHYTSEINIMKVIQPLFLDELYNEFDAAKKSAKALDSFHQKLASLTFLDPACGCGNFLVTTYRELRRLEIQVLLKKRKHNTNTLLAFGAGELSRLHVNQFYGIEIEEFPALVARTAMYLADHQMTRELQKEFGQEKARIPLQEPATIVHGNALTIEWAEVIAPEKLSYIIGNPPFLGQTYQSKQQKEEVAKVLSGIKKTGTLDFVSAWYGKAADLMKQNPKIQTALVSTNSITQGEQVGILWKYLLENGVKINFAHQTFRWTNDAKGKAAVHCVIVGFALFDKPTKWLYLYSNIDGEGTEVGVKNINPYLVDGPNILLESRSKPVCKAPKMIRGSQPTDGGNLLLTQEEKDTLVMNDPLVAKFIRPFLMGNEFINNIKRYCLWLKDCSPNELKEMPEVMRRIESVRKVRLASKKAATQKLASLPFLFGEIRTSESCYLAVPTVSSENRSYIPIGFLPPDVIAGNKIYFIPNANIFNFGILTSKMHMVWTRYTCGRLKSDYNYSNKIVYNNFPWPGCGANVTDLSVEAKEKIEAAAQAVLDARAQFPNSSLADLYDPRTMPPVLVKAHAALDRAVDAAYSYRDTGLDADRIAFLFERYQKIINS